MTEQLSERLSPLEQIRKLDADRARILAQAKSEALTRVEAALADLNSLGFAYDLTHDGKPEKKRSRSLKDAPCNVCGFKTEPPHDARRHRAQGDDKKPFTDEELAGLGLMRLGALQ